MKLYYITEYNYSCKHLIANDFLKDYDLNCLNFQFSNYAVKTYSFPISPYEEEICLQIVPHEPCGYYIDTFSGWDLYTYLFDEEEKVLYLIIDKNLFVFKDIYVNLTIDNSINHLINDIENTDEENTLLKILMILILKKNIN